MVILGPLVAPSTSTVTVGLPSAYRAGGALHAVDQEKHGQLDGGAGLGVQPVDLEDVADGNLLLAATGADDRVHHRRARLTLYCFDDCCFEESRSRARGGHASTTAPWKARR